MDYVCKPYTETTDILRLENREKMSTQTTVGEEEIGHLHRTGSTVEFGRTEFLEIVHVENPKILYKSSGRHFFFLAGLAVSTSECSDEDFGSGRVVLPWISQTAN